MKIRELNDAERDALHQKGFEKADQLIDAIETKGLSPLEWFNAVSGIVERADYAVEHCSSNFNAAGEYCPPDGQHLDDLNEVFVERMYCDGIKAEGTRQRAFERMSASEPARFNGEKRICEKWAAKLGLGLPQEITIPQKSSIVMDRQLAYK